MKRVEETLDKETLAAQIDNEVDQFVALIGKAKDLESPEAVGEWSLRDLLAHLVAWHEECLWALQSTLDGNYERRDYSDVDGWNRAAVGRYEGLSGEDLLERTRATGHEIAAKVRTLPDALWAEKRRVQTWPHASTIRHYREHEEDVRGAIGGTG